MVKDFLFPTASRLDTVDHSQGVKLTGPEADHSLPTNADFKKA
jgi:hypothetical protein